MIRTRLVWLIALLLHSVAFAAERPNKLADFADYEPLNFTQANTPLIALYPRRYGSGQEVLSRRAPAGHKSDPLWRPSVKETEK